MTCSTRQLVCLVAFAAGCATSNPVANFYQDRTIGATPEQLAAFFEPSSTTPRVMVTEDYDGDLLRLGEQGYWVVGISNFTWSGMPTQQQLSKKALEVGADIVLYNSEYSHTEEGVRPVLGVVPGSSTTVSSSGSANLNAYGSASASAYGSGGYAYGTGSYTGHGYGNYYETSTISTPPQFYTYYVPYSARVNQFQVAFLRRGKRPILGIRGMPIPEEMRAALQRNTGVFVWLVQNSTPAFRANLLAGDVIVGIGDRGVSSPEDLSQVLFTHAGQPVDIRFIRNGQEMSVSATLNPLPE